MSRPAKWIQHLSYQASLVKKERCPAGLPVCGDNIPDRIVTESHWFGAAGAADCGQPSTRVVSEKGLSAAGVSLAGQGVLLGDPLAGDVAVFDSVCVVTDDGGEVLGAIIPVGYHPPIRVCHGLH